MTCYGKLCLALLSSSSCRSEPEAGGASIVPRHALRVVRPKQFTALQALEKHGTLEKALLPLGFSVQWLEFAAGPQQLEALGADALDIASTAESPPVARDSISFWQPTHWPTCSDSSAICWSGSSLRSSPLRSDGQGHL